MAVSESAQVVNIRVSHTRQCQKRSQCIGRKVCIGNYSSLRFMTSTDPSKLIFSSLACGSLHRLPFGQLEILREREREAQHLKYHLDFMNVKCWIFYFRHKNKDINHVLALMIWPMNTNNIVLCKWLPLSEVDQFLSLPPSHFKISC